MVLCLERSAKQNFRNDIDVATHGPIPNANSKVPNPTTPPRDQPIKTTETSIILRTVARVRLLKITN